MEAGAGPVRDHGTEIAAVNEERGWRRYLLRFTPLLEESYRLDQRVRAVRAFRHTAVFILLLYVLLSSGIYALMPATEIGHWLAIYGWVGVIIVAAHILSYVTALDRWFPVYVGLGSFLAVALSVAVTGVIHETVAGLTYAGVMYAMVIVYGICGLRFTHALAAGWLGGLGGDMLATAMHGSIDWSVLHRTYTGSSLLGMFLCYFSELRDRESFLQRRLLELGHEQTISYARQVEQLSREDPLTGLRNRRHFNEVLETEWRRAMRNRHQIALLIIDVDHFKSYNDVFGHPAGDSCLIKVANIIAAHARRSGDLVVRFGGEEFLVFLPETGEAAAAQYADQLVADVRAARIPHAPGAGSPIVSVSIGVAVMTPCEDMHHMELLQAADQAMYRVKQAGRDGWQLIVPLPSAANRPDTPPAAANQPVVHEPVAGWIQLRNSNRS